MSNFFGLLVMTCLLLAVSSLPTPDDWRHGNHSPGQFRALVAKEAEAADAGEDADGAECVCPEARSEKDAPAAADDKADDDSAEEDADEEDEEEGSTPGEDSKDIKEKNPEAKSVGCCGCGTGCGTGCGGCCHNTCHHAHHHCCQHNHNHCCHHQHHHCNHQHHTNHCCHHHNLHHHHHHHHNHHHKTCCHNTCGCGCGGTGGSYGKRKRRSVVKKSIA